MPRSSGASRTSRQRASSRPSSSWRSRRFSPSRRACSFRLPGRYALFRRATISRGGSLASNGSDNVGSLIEIKGVVVDAVFPNGLPAVYSALRIERPEGGHLIAEVQQFLGDDRVRAVAMDSTDGLARGTEVVDTGGPISVPVGEGTLGRLWNVIGDPIDEKEAPPKMERWPIHRDPPAFQDLSPKV